MEVSDKESQDLFMFDSPLTLESTGISYTYTHTHTHINIYTPQMTAIHTVNNTFQFDLILLQNEPCYWYNFRVKWQYMAKALCQKYPEQQDINL